MTTAGQTKIRPEIESILIRLKNRIRRYVVVEGTALVVASAVGLFWLSFVVDWIYFRICRLELPVWFRATFTMASACLIVVGFLLWVVYRSARRMQTRALALVLEKRFPELQNRLITAVERDSIVLDKQNELTEEMLSRTVDVVAGQVKELSLDDVFEMNPLRQAITIAVVMLASFVTLVAYNRAALARWTSGYWNLNEQYWNRETELTVKVMVDGGERIKEFTNRSYKHPRGSDLNLLIEVPEGRKVPEHVDIRFQLADGRGGGRVTASKIGERQFRHSIGDVLDHLEFWVRGGDYASRQGYFVEVVDPPRIDHIDLACQFPAYTGMNPPAEADGVTPRTSVPVMGSQVALPIETEFMLQADSNKPLREIVFRCERFDLLLQPPRDASFSSLDEIWSTTLQVKSPQGDLLQKKTWPTPAKEIFADAGRTHFRQPFLLTGEAIVLLEQGELTSRTIPLPADSLVRIDLTDDDDINSTEPTRLTVGGKTDLPPAITTEPRGIGMMVTRQASIPVAGTITDDYGVASAEFVFNVGDEAEPRPVKLRNQPENLPLEFRLQRSDEEEFERFEVLPWDLPVGTKFRLSVAAQDADNLNGPNRGHGDVYQFQVVTREELLSQFYGRELNLRRRFEQIITELKQARDDLTKHRERYQKEQAAGAVSAELNAALAAFAERSLHQVRKNSLETASIEEAFRDIREEMVNNAVDTPQMLTRIDERIVAPLHEINQTDYPELDRRLGTFKVVHGRGDDPASSMDDAVKVIDRMLTRMQSVLSEMQDLLEFHEAVEFLKRIIDLESKLIDETQTERKRKLLEQLQR